MQNVWVSVLKVKVSVGRNPQKISLWTFWTFCNKTWCCSASSTTGVFYGGFFNFYCCHVTVKVEIFSSRNIFQTSRTTLGVDLTAPGDKPVLKCSCPINVALVYLSNWCLHFPGNKVLLFDWCCLGCPAVAWLWCYLVLQSMRLKIIAAASSAERRFSSWIGGSILASLVSQHCMCGVCVHHLTP